LADIHTNDVTEQAVCAVDSFAVLRTTLSTDAREDGTREEPGVEEGECRIRAAMAHCGLLAGVVLTVKGQNMVTIAACCHVLIGDMCRWAAARKQWNLPGTCSRAVLEIETTRLET
jgi:hypothetical protein